MFEYSIWDDGFIKKDDPKKGSVYEKSWWDGNVKRDSFGNPIKK